LASEKNVRFDFGLLDLDPFVAKTTFEIDAGARGRGSDGRGNSICPEIEIRIAEGDAENVTAGVFAKTADEADVGFAAGIGEAHGETSSGANLLRERIPAPWRLRTRVCVSSEKTRPEVSVPRKDDGDLS